MQNDPKALEMVARSKYLRNYFSEQTLLYLAVALRIALGAFTETDNEVLRVRRVCQTRCSSRKSGTELNEFHIMIGGDYWDKYASAVLSIFIALLKLRSIRIPELFFHSDEYGLIFHHAASIDICIIEMRIWNGQILYFAHNHTHHKI